jgi:hypothetical protein
MAAVNINEEINRYVTEFNRLVKQLLRDLEKMFPSDHKIRNIKNKVSIAIEVKSTIIIEKVGPQLNRHKDKIYNMDDGTEEFFMQNDFDDDILAAADADMEKVDIARYLVPKLKECAKTMSAEDKAKYKMIVVDLLHSYMEYCFLLAQ